MGVQQSLERPLAADCLFNFPDADVILRSCDGVDFAAHAILLKLISPLFKDIPRPAQQLPFLRPVIEMMEDSHSLRLLLAFGYPRTVCEVPELLTIADIKRAAVLARRYDITFLHTEVEQALARYCCVSPVIAFAVSWKFGYHNAARAAARQSLDVPDIFKSITCSDDVVGLGEVSAATLIVLYRYRVSASTQLEHVLQLNSFDRPVTWIAPSQVEALLLHEAESACTCTLAIVWFRQPNATRASEWRVYSWWWEYVSNVVASLQSERRPRIDDALNDPMSRCMRMASQCCICDGGVVAARVLHATREALRCEIEELLKTVSACI
ncbi:unnamed protein product [Peniophora sp. CBMAI 1063]|nr:unnamed protein product [Peniophora sp. CBMAI 1063]